MAKSTRTPGDPVRRLMMQARDRAGLYGREHEPDVDELRGVLRKALPRPVNRLRWALQAGCMRIPTEAGHPFRREAGQRSDLMSATR